MFQYHLFGSCFIIIVQTCPSPSLSCLWPILWKNTHLCSTSSFWSRTVQFWWFAQCFQSLDVGLSESDGRESFFSWKLQKIGTYGYAAIPQIHRLIIIFWHIPHCNAINIAIAITWGRPLTFPWFSRDFISWWIFHNLHWSIDPLHEVQSLWGKYGWILRRLIGTRRFFTGFWWSNVTCSPFSRKVFTGNHRFSHIETGNHRCFPCFYRVFRFWFSHQSIDLSADSLRRRWRPPSKVSLRQQLGATATAVPTLLRGGHWPSAAWLRDWGGLTWWLKR